MSKDFRTQLRRLLIRAVLFVSGRGWRSRVDLMNEIRRSRGGSLGVVHKRGDDWLVDGGDHLMWCSSSDGLIAVGLAKHGAWQREDLNHAFDKLAELGLLRHGWFIDVGANIGTHVVYAALRAEIEKVLAIEPEPLNFSFIERNVRINDLEDAVTALQVAASAAPDVLHLEVNGALQGRHIVRPAANSKTIEVPALPLDQIIAEHRIAPTDIALVWIDVESHEHSVFRGMPDVLDAKVPVFFEYSCKSVSDEVRAAWCRDVEARYDHAFVVRPDGVQEVSFEEAFSQELADLLIC